MCEEQAGLDVASGSAQELLDAPEHLVGRRLRRQTDVDAILTGLDAASAKSRALSVFPSPIGASTTIKDGAWRAAATSSVST